MNDVVTLIPAVGYGTRVGMRTNQSKELLINPATGLPLIEWTLRRAINPLLIIRKEKQDLIGYAEHHNIKYITMDATKEWPQTILNAGTHWKQNNLLLLPDTQFSDPDYTIDSVLNGLKHDKVLSFAIHKVDDVCKWGQVTFDYTEEKPFDLRERPEGWAWGAIGFTRQVGHGLFTAYLNRTKYEYYPEAVSFTKLQWFKDITRGDK